MDKQKDVYVKPRLEVIETSEDDVIRTSGESDDTTEEEGI